MFCDLGLPGMQHHDIPQEQRGEYAALIEQLHHSTQEIDTKLPTYMFVLKSEETIKRLIAIVRPIRVLPLTLLIVTFIFFGNRFSL
jgi:hypothetical protein